MHPTLESDVHSRSHDLQHQQVPQEQLEFQRLGWQALPKQEQLLAQEPQQLALQKCRAPERDPKRSSLRELRILLPVPKTLRSRQALHLLWEQMPSSQRLFWQEPSLQVLRHQREQRQLSSQQPS